MSNHELTTRQSASTPSMMAPPMSFFDRESGEKGQNEMPHIGAAMWRYRWAVALPMMIGMMAGFLLFLRTPDTFRSTTQLMIESDRPAVMDTMTGEVLGGVPSIDIVQSQLFSDAVIRMAYEDARMLPFHEDFDDGFQTFVSMVKSDGALELEPVVSDTKTAQSVVALLHFDSGDQELSQTAVKCFSNALQNYYNRKYRDSQDELREFITEAFDKMKPDLERQMDELGRFRVESNLEFDEQGNAINPHRVLGQQLLAERSDIYRQLSDAAYEHEAIKQTADAAKDNNPVMALTVVGQFLGSRFNIPELTRTDRAAMGAGDETLALLDVDQQLAPMKAERDALVAELGENHPLVRVKENQIRSLEEKQKQFASDRTMQMQKLIEDAEGRKEEAKAAIEAILTASKAKVAKYQGLYNDLGKQIAAETQKARALAEKEVEYRNLQRKIEGSNTLADQVNEMMSRAEMSSASESETRVVELVAAGRAYKVSPIIWKLVGIGGLLGLALGSGLAFLLEKNANTFRDPDEISAALGIPVLTHVPFFKKRTKRGKDAKEEFKGLDSSLAVLHSPSSVVAESIRSLRTAVFFEMAANNGKIIQLTSPLPGDGKSTLAGNLACAIAQSGKSVLAIDCDLRRPQFTDNFALQDKLGLTNVLNGECEWQEACHTVESLTHLDVMPSGPIPANPAEALTLPDMADLLERLRDHYDYVIVDTPPLLVVTDPSILASMVDGVVMALRIRRKSKLNAKEAVNILHSVGATVLGTIINNSDESSSSDGYRGYGYYRYSRYAKKYYRRGVAAGEVLSPGSKKRSGMVVGGRSTPVEGRPVSPAAIRAEANGTASAAQPTSPTVVQDAEDN